tara:strand:+ start:4124 stop:5656 length:1533 start_codon:yes stop_codon:yes gene_type:complete
MLNILQIEDRLKDMSEDVIKKMVTDPNPSVPPFLATNELNRRDRMRKEFQMRQAEEMPTVAEQLVTGAGMPNEAMSQMAMNMAPKSDIAGNAGLEAMMPKATMPETEEDEIMLMEDEDPMGMSYGGLVNSRAMVMGQPLVSSMPPMADTSFDPLGRFSNMRQQRDNLGFKNLGSNIVNRIGERSQGEVDEFIGEVRNMADERFDLDLNQQPQFDSGGKGFPPALRPMISQKPNIPQGFLERISTAQPMYRKEGGLASMSNGGYIERLLTGIPNYLGNKMFGIGSTDEDEVDADSVGYDDRLTRMKKTGTDDESFDNNVVTDTNRPPPPPPPPAGPSSFDKILGMIQEDRESAKEQRDRDRYLALMQFGLNLAKRGQLEDTGEGLKTLAMSNKAYQDQLAKLRGFDVQAMLTKENIAGRERAAGITAQAALERALAKTGLTEEDILQSISRQQKNIVDIENQLYGTEGLTSSLPKADKAQKMLDLQNARKRLYYLEGELEKRRASNVIKVD